MDLTTLHERTVAEFVARVEAVPDATWSHPTPCTEWDVRAVVNHVVGEDRWTAPLLEGATIAEVGDRFDGDLLGDDPVAVAREAAAEAVASVAKELPSGRRVHLSYGDEEMGEYLRQLAADHLIHAWDVAAATGGDTTLDPELVAEIAPWFAEREELYRARRHHRSTGRDGVRRRGDAAPRRLRPGAGLVRLVTRSRTCVRRTGVRYSLGGFQQPVVDVEGAGGRPLRARAGRASAGQPVVERRWRRAGVEPPAPALPAPGRRRRHRAAPRVGALRRAALPLQLLLPRRRVAPRGAGRRGRPARPGGAGAHRPRRLLRRRPLRRGGPGGRACRRCSAPRSP